MQKAFFKREGIIRGERSIIVFTFANQYKPLHEVSINIRGKGDNCQM